VLLLHDTKDDLNGLMSDLDLMHEESNDFPQVGVSLVRSMGLGVSISVTLWITRVGVSWRSIR
jgi:hypothetical protein